MPAWFRRLLVVVVLAALVAAGWYFLVRKDPITVTVHPVARGRVEATVTNSKAGTVMTRRRAALSPEIGGRVAELPVAKGDRVKEGQVLLRIAASDLGAQLAVAQRAVDSARASQDEACLAAEQAARDHDRTRDLAREAIVSQDRLEQARLRRDASASSCNAAGAAVRQAEASVNLSRVALSKTVLVAPFDGVIAELHVEVGEFVTPSAPGVFMPPAIDLLDPEGLYISAPLDEVDAGRVRVGLPVRVSLDPRPGEDFAGHLVRVAPYVEDAREQSRTFEIEVELDDVTAMLPGTTADVEVILEGRESVLRVPAYALLESDRVLVVREGILEEVPVKVGLRNWEFVEVETGLAEGDLVVVSLDRAEVKAGARVSTTQELPK